MLAAKEKGRDERDIFSAFQRKFASEYKSVFEDNLAPKTVVVIPSLTLDAQMLAKIDAHLHYEERMLCMLLLLKMPRTHIIYITSVPVDTIIIDYYLHMLRGITAYHARQRIHFFSCYDASEVSLTEKILSRPRLIERIKTAIPSNHSAHISCFNVTNHERRLAVELGLPLYGCDPDLYFWGTKSGSREIFRGAGIALPEGYENLRTEQDIVKALAGLYKQNHNIKRAIIKVNDGFSGDGNAVFEYQDIHPGNDIEEQLRKQLPERLKIIAKNLFYKQFIQKFESMGGIAERFLEGEEKTSPSVQCRINPIGKTEIISTHDQWMGGPDEQVFLGGSFPANEEYSIEIGLLAERIAEQLKLKGVLGRFAIDFISVKEKNGWKHYAIEINLRKGGTTYPYLMLQFLTDGEYDATRGKYFLPGGDEKYYIFTDNLQDDRLKGLTPPDLMDIVIMNHLHFDGVKQEGVMFHLIGALSQYGKLGLICIASSRERATYFYNKTINVLFTECNRK
ncbi:MAG TPA: peptide ligase PGM1-related protein [Puia sp.]|nr:peptide ligase PGM1-related protein [Puia sp.]